MQFNSWMHQDPRPEYNLFATIVHSGFSPDSGHYYAYIKVFILLINFVFFSILDLCHEELLQFMLADIVCACIQDAMSRWYCCNDSFVSLSTLQEVLSEKVYILFFCRSKQRPPTANTALGTNGIKSNGCNGNDTSKISKTGPIKAVNSKQFVNQSLDKDKINSSKVDEVPSSPRIKLSSFGNSDTQQFPAPDNVKLIFHRKESCEKNGDVKSSNFMKKSENNSILLKDMNGVTKSSDSAIDGERRHSVFLSNGKDKIQSVSVDSSVVKCEVDGITNRMSAGRGPNHQVLQNGSINCVADKLGSKQKFKEEDSCTLNAEDARSPKKSEELNSKRKMQDEDSYNSFAEDGQTHLKLQEWSSNGKLQTSNSCISLTEELSCKRKVQGKDKCILFAEDAESRGKLEELKDTYVILYL